MQGGGVVRPSKSVHTDGGHLAPDSAMDRIYWPGLRKQLHVNYQSCTECSYNRISQTCPANECSQSDLFENFFPNSYLQADFLKFNDTDIMVAVDILT